MKKGEATVVKNAGSHFLLSEFPAWEPFPAVLRGKVRLKGGSSTNPVALGDHVRYEWADGDESASIVEILPRKNHLVRKSTNLSKQEHVIAANIDRALLVTSLYFPQIKLPFLDRQLVTCEMFGIPATIVLSKVDMYRAEAPESIAAFHEIYEGAGYEVVETSIVDGSGIERVRELCREGVVLLSGESGVGKSSLVNALDPSVGAKVGEISVSHLQGKHTTSLYEMYPLCSGGYVIDTPGLRSFGLVGLEKEEIARYFPEMLAASEGCRFTPCTHTHEPGCAVKAAVDEGTISAERYNSYLGMLEEDTKFRQ